MLQRRKFKLLYNKMTYELKKGMWNMKTKVASILIIVEYIYKQSFFKFELKEILNRGK
jgi:hypothetical protein